MPADSVTNLSKNKGPAMQMDLADHQQTASWGASKEATAYRGQQRALVDQGQLGKAQQMDIDDIRSKFGAKYDDAIDQVRDYTRTLGF